MQPKKVARSPIRASAAELVAARFRQIHLDFHTSELIPDVGSRFNADEFAGRLADARVNWVTLFAKCHHGMSYYPTKAGTVHPSLKIDLLGEQVEACRKRGIVTPAYISVRVDEHNAKVHPEWVGRLKDGKAWKWAGPLDAGWYNHCLYNPDYIEELGAQAVEVLKWYDVEGIFWDMCYNPDPGCYCPRCFDGMKKAGLDFANDDDHRKFEYQLTRDYTRKLTRIIRGVRRNATVFFNGRMRPSIRGELDVFTHVEIEALPTGGWGYAFFPVHVRYGRVLGKPVQGMTARFHKSWADFGGVKTPDQLLYEAGTILAAGAVMNVGDQCHPRGVLDKGAYQVIGTSFKHVEACEPWCVDATPETEIGVMMLPETLDGGSKAAPAGTKGGMLPWVDGAGRMLLELKQQYDLIYPDTPLARYRVVILPDRGVLDAKAKKSLQAFLARGGAVLASYRATMEGDAFGLPALPIRSTGAFSFKPCYLALGAELGRGLPESNFVFYDECLQVKAAAGAETLGRLCSTYFNRAYDHFCSHNQTPDDHVTEFPIAVLKGRVAYLSPAVFQAYRDHSYGLYKELVARTLAKLLPEPLVKAHAPSAMEISLLRQTKPGRLVAHLVNFQPQRRHVNVEWIEELYPVRDVKVGIRTEQRPRGVYLAPQRKSLPYQMKGAYCEITVPEVKAHQMVVLED